MVTTVELAKHSVIARSRRRRSARCVAHDTSMPAMAFVGYANPSRTNGGPAGIVYHARRKRRASQPWPGPDALMEGVADGSVRLRDPGVHGHRRAAATCRSGRGAVGLAASSASRFVLTVPTAASVTAPGRPEWFAYLPAEYVRTAPTGRRRASAPIGVAAGLVTVGSGATRSTSWASSAAGGLRREPRRPRVAHERA